MKKMIVSAITGALLLQNPSSAALTSIGLDKNLYTSDFMIGSVVVSIVFPDSDGTLDAEKESWADERKSQVISEIMAGLDWWTKQNPHSPLNFTVVSESVKTKYEPINRPYYDETLWIPDVLKKLGFTGDRFTATRAYVNSLRSKYKADWGYVIYVVDSLNDSNGKFADGLFAYAYLGGPFMVMTYDNNGYGISNMDVVAAHETGHIFHALDQYAGASSPADYSKGYFPTINGNHAYSSQAKDPNSIMRGGVRWSLDDWAKIMVGWRDSNSNNKDDILDQPPQRTIASQVVSNAAPGSLGFEGKAWVSVLPRQNNAFGWGLTVDTIAKVEYQLANGDWAEATAIDGKFDYWEENYRIVIPPSQIPASQAITAQDLSVRVVTSFATKSGASGAGGGGGAPATLDTAHAYPNPFKPNSEAGHSIVTFTDLTPGSKIKIFTTAGEPVIDILTPASSSTALWQGIDEGGQAVASGVYYYLITDEEGHKKEGKIAVIR